MVRKSTPSPRRSTGSGSRTRTTRSRSRGRSVERKAVSKSSVTTRSRSRSRGPAAAPAATSSVQAVVKLEESATLLRRRARTPTRARATAAKATEVESKEVPKTPVVVVAATAVTKTPTVPPSVAEVAGFKVDGTEAASSRPERESPKAAAGGLPVRAALAAVPAAATVVVAAPAVTETPAASATVPHHFEFGGAWGAALLIPALPLIVAYAVLCSQNNWDLYCPWVDGLPKNIPWSCHGFTCAFFVVVAWNAVLALLYVLPIGPLVEGAPLKDGTRLRYRCNAMIAFVLTVVAFFAENAYNGKSMIGDYIKGNLPHLAAASLVFSVLVAVLVYLKACRAKASQLSPAATGNLLNDFFMGRELNPRIGSFDLKFFFELRPGLIGWTLINLSLTWPSGTAAGRLVAASQILYVADGLWNEPAILTTFDFLQEGFGYMLAFGDLVWVPFLYSLQTQFVTVEGNGIQDVRILVAIALLNVLGFYIFRAANNQKNEFRRNPYNPKLSQLESIATPLGKRLLVGGWWGVCRRPNYLGDLIIALSWALPCGCTHALPYLHLISFAVLLVHRLQRDESHCRQRYGASTWDDFCRRVPYRIVPYIY